MLMGVALYVIVLAASPPRDFCSIWPAACITMCKLRIGPCRWGMV